jgi:hypothetical protein
LILNSYQILKSWDTIAYISNVPKFIYISKLFSYSTVQKGSGIIIYKYHSSCDELIKRLQVLRDSIEADNNSPVVRNEIVSILNILLNNCYINAKQYMRD